MSNDKKLAPETIAAQALGWIEPTTRAISPPIHVSSTYERDEDGQYRSGRNYSRTDNPSYDQPEAVLAALEGGKAALLFSSGMAAATTLFQTLKPGDHIIGPKVMYWSLRNWLVATAEKWGAGLDLVDMRDLSAVKAAIKPGRTKLIWAETPANPLWHVTDIAAAAEIAHAAGARFAVDSTAATPVLTKPLALGADIVMHSATKYLNGHSDVIAGALVTREADAFWEQIKLLRLQQGGVLGPFEAWLLLRGMRTLYPRVRMAVANAQFLAEKLAGNSRLEEVLYPGLPDFSGHAVAARQMHGGFGGMLSIRVKGGEAAAVRLAAHVKVWKRATSLGGVESLMEHRASVEGPNSPIPKDLLRLSVGVEDRGDLLADLEQALQAN
ncbi:MAG TPA: aminotransferase class V-fold PLP-dependent enzyme [Rhizomicrobium sp.]|nr:aminotransferase class V-fold PLP-dependent enzyme [Rhizomicrobium sp.]